MKFFIFWPYLVLLSFIIIIFIFHKKISKRNSSFFETRNKYIKADSVLTSNIFRDQDTLVSVNDILKISNALNFSNKDKTKKTLDFIKTIYKDESFSKSPQKIDFEVKVKENFLPLINEYLKLDKDLKSESGPEYIKTFFYNRSARSKDKRKC